MNATDIVRGLKGKWHGSYGIARCPAHKDNTPSLSISIGTDGRTLVKCHAGCSQDSVMGALTALNLWGGDALTNLRAFTPKPKDDEANSEYALKLWDECVPVVGTLAELYLASRGITIDVSDALRFHQGLKHPDGGTWPAMVAIVTKPHIGGRAIHRTFLQPDGSGKAPVPRPKMMLGPCAGGAVRLTPAREDLCVGEGIETCLSINQATGRPVWAALSTSGLKALELPSFVKEVMICADADPAGEDAAVNAAQRWKEAGLSVKIARPSVGNDFNDVLLQKGGAA